MSLARVAIVNSPLGDALVLRAMYGYEELGRAFRYELELVAANPDVDFGAVLGQTMTVQLELPNDSTREFTGHVTEFSLVEGAGQAVLYRAVLSPWLQLLSYRSNCRIFQRQKVPDVIKQIFRDHGFSDCEERLTDEYRTWEYLVQYRESDFAFVSRLMEQEGIYYFAKHSGGMHVIVLCDSTSAHEPFPGYEEIPYFPPGERQRERDHIDSWHVTRRIKPGSVAATDFDFTRPKATLLAQRTEPEELPGASYEDFDYPGEHLQSDEGEKEVKVRLEIHHAEREVVEATGTAAGISVGSTFTLADFPRTDQNKEYLVVRAHYHIEVNADESGIPASAPVFRVDFSALDAKRSFRSARITPKPLVEGLQTAIVVGPAGEEIYTDAYGRVKVKFHWDRESKGDEESSCWIRVAQLWAGTNFGGIHIPRIGQEVIVQFLEGDPDRPVVTGRVYNFDNQVPYELPANQTQSGLKSRSSKGGGTNNFNELRFEDAIGEEQVYFQAEKDLESLIKNDEKRDIGASQTVNVGTSQTITVAQGRSVSSGSESISTGSRSKTVSKTETVSIGTDQVVTVGGKRTSSVDQDDKLDVGAKLVITAVDEIVLQTGSAKLVMKSNGDVSINGKNVQVDGSGNINMKARADMKLKATKISGN